MQFNRLLFDPAESELLSSPPRNSPVPGGNIYSFYLCLVFNEFKLGEKPFYTAKNGWFIANKHKF